MKLIITVKQAPLGSHQMIGKQFSFDEKGGVLGRSPQSDIVLPDPNRYVSSRHAMVTFENGVFSIHDQSSNGLFANGSSDAIGNGRPFVLENGTSLKAGEYLLEVAVDAGAASEEESPARPQLKAVPSAPRPEKPSSNEGPPSEQVALELAMRLGLHGMTENKLQQMPEAVTEMVRSCVVGVMDVLSSRRQVKHQLKMDTTVIQAGSDNNALKFSASADEAIERMFSKSENGYLPPEAALVEAFEDIADHQVAMMSAIMQVYQRLVGRFDPEVLESSLREGSKEGGLFSGKPRLWDEYKDKYQQIAFGGKASVHDDFVKEFAEAYAEQLARLKKERGKVAQ